MLSQQKRDELVARGFKLISCQYDHPFYSKKRLPTQKAINDVCPTCKAINRQMDMDNRELGGKYTGAPWPNEDY